MATRDLIIEFYQTHKEQFPDLTLRQVLEICRNPFKMLKEAMRWGHLPEMRIQYLGTFKVKKARAIGMLNHIEGGYQKGKISEEYYTKMKYHLTNFLKRTKENEEDQDDNE